MSGPECTHGADGYPCCGCFTAPPEPADPVEAAPADDECPGEGLCHGCLQWCSRCGDVKHVCDTRLRDERCAEHPVPPQSHVLRAELRMWEKKAADARAALREAEPECERYRESMRARTEYDRQVEATFWKCVAGAAEKAAGGGT